MSETYITAATLWLPGERDSAWRAVAEGRADAERTLNDAFEELPVSSRLAPPEMAVLAARTAITEAGIEPARLSLLLHAWIYYQGHDLWSPPHYIADQLQATAAEPLGIQQMCNGGAAAMAIAIDRLNARTDTDTVLITTADRFPLPAFDRWRADYGLAYGDGATAVLLSREPGPYVVTALTTCAAPELERMHRGHDGFGDAARQTFPTIDVRRTKRAYLQDGDGPLFARTAAASLRTVVLGALATAGLEADDPTLRCITLPRVGRTVLDQAYRPALAEITKAELLDLGRDTGHLGAGDAAANLAALHARGHLRPGETALLISAGAGYTWSCIAVRAC